MPAEFLMQQLQWREALDDAVTGHDEASLQALDNETRAGRDRLLDEIGHALDVESDPARAASLVRQLMFIEKFGTEIASALDAMRDSRASA